MLAGKKRQLTTQLMPSGPATRISLFWLHFQKGLMESISFVSLVYQVNYWYGLRESISIPKKGPFICLLINEGMLGML